MTVLAQDAISYVLPQEGPSAAGRARHPAPISTSMGQRPAYAVGAVDHALLAIQLLARRPAIRLTELADELSIGRATAHRLLQMLVFRGFAVQNADRSYAAGPALYGGRLVPGLPDSDQLAAVSRPHLHSLCVNLGESVSLIVMVGIEAVYLDSLPGARPLAATLALGGRAPAERVAGGLTLLAQLDQHELRRRFAGRPDESFAGLERSLDVTRRRGFGLMLNEIDPGYTGLGALVAGPDGRAVAAVGCSAPTMRLGRQQTPVIAARVKATAMAIGAEMVAQLQ